MRIGIDARELCGRATGAGRYLSGLLQHWAADEGMHRHEFILYAPQRLDRRSIRRFATRVIEGGAGTWWSRCGLPATATDHLDVSFAPRIPRRFGCACRPSSRSTICRSSPIRNGFDAGRDPPPGADPAVRPRAPASSPSQSFRRELIERLGVPGRLCTSFQRCQ
jgi:hypothetical protein